MSPLSPTSASVLLILAYGPQPGLLFPGSWDQVGVEELKSDGCKKTGYKGLPPSCSADGGLLTDKALALLSLDKLFAFPCLSLFKIDLPMARTYLLRAISSFFVFPLCFSPITLLILCLIPTQTALAYSPPWSAIPFNTQSIPLHVKNPCNNVWAPQAFGSIPLSGAFPRSWDQNNDVRRSLSTMYPFC